MSRLDRGADAIARWTLRHKWQYRALCTLLMLLLVYLQFTNDWGATWWDYLFTTITFLLLGAVFFAWWRIDVLDEFDERTRAAIGHDADIVILCARLKLRTSTVWKLNGVMRRYDIMRVPALDLPPEARELREILGSMRT